MATGKKYYWLKLKDSFMTSDTIDYFMGQPNGAQYVVLYQLLCLKIINTDGRLSRQIGEIIIPYDVAKIKRDCKYFTEDVINNALQLYIHVGLVYQDIGDFLVMVDLYNPIESCDMEREQRLANRPARIRVEDPFSDLCTGDDILLSALKDFEKMRLKIKRPMTDRAKALIISRLQTFPRECWVAILEQSIMNGWQNIYPLKGETVSSAELKRTYERTEDSL